MADVAIQENDGSRSDSSATAAAPKVATNVTGTAAAELANSDRVGNAKSSGDGAGAPSTIESTVKWLSPYKELILLITALVGAAIGVKDYFATKRDVKLLECRQSAQIGAMQSEQKVRSLTDKYLATKQQVLELHEQQNRPAGRSKAELRSLQMAVIAKEKDAEDISKERDVETAAQRSLHDRLQPGVCEDAIDAQKQPAVTGEAK